MWRLEYRIFTYLATKKNFYNYTKYINFYTNIYILQTKNKILKKNGTVSGLRVYKPKILKQKYQVVKN